MKFLILGAGPAGLSFANRLRDLGETSFLLIEQESQAGGLCRSLEIDGAPLDIGGGHFLDNRKKHVNDFLFRFMPENEWNIFDRDSRIDLNGTEIGHPIESNIWQLDLDDQIQYLKSIANAGCNSGKPMPKKFVDWITWKLGDKIAEDYMIPYNRKMFSDHLDQLGTYWLEKLPKVDFDDSLKSCLTKSAIGIQPGHAKFYYPKKFGYGELWKKMADTIQNKIVFDSKVTSIDFENRIIKTNKQEQYTADVIVSTIPWTDVKHLVGVPLKIKRSINKLKHSSIEIRYFEHQLKTKAHWIYYPNPQLPYHRILNRPTFSIGSKGYWTETREDRTDMFLPHEGTVFSYVNTYAYPLNTIDKPQIMSDLLNWSRSKNVYGLGRWGEHQHYNSDVTVELSINLADKLSVI